MSIITLTTDFGLKDHFVGALKGKILSEKRNATIIDISHYIDPFNIVEASYIIAAAYKSFPKGTVHIIGVDMELNKENKHIVMQWNDHYFIAADNGILSILSQKIIPQKIVAITIHDRFSSEATDLDVFVKVACHLSNGGLLGTIGEEITSIKQIINLQAITAEDENSIRGHVIYIDHFGNVVTNITNELFHQVAKGRAYEIILKTKNIKTILPKYGSIASSNSFPLKNYEGERLALFNEAGYLEIAIYKSNPAKFGCASSLLGLHYMDTITLKFSTS